MSSVKIPGGAGVPLYPPQDKSDLTRKFRKTQKNIHGDQTDRTIYRQTHDREMRFLPQPQSNNNGSVKIPDGSNAKNGSKTGSLTVKFQPAHRKGETENMHAKCSTKWSRYGGCIPMILEALETIKDLDSALKPWEECLNNKERTIILKEQTSWERAWEIFNWFKMKGCYELNVIHYNIMLRVLGKARKWTLVENLWLEMAERKILPINSTYGTLIDVYSKGGMRVEALKWLDLMNKSGMEPDEVTMGIVVQTYKKSGEFDKAEQFFNNWSICKSLSVKNTPKMLSLYTYNTLIDNFGKSGQLKEACETFDRMLEDGIVPTTVTFNTMIHIYGNNGRLGEVTSLIRKMEELNCPPDTRTYNILSFLYAKHGDIETARNYFRAMKQPDLVSYRTLLYALSIRLMVDEAEELIAEMDEQNLPIDEYTQSALTRMYLQANLIEKSWLWFSRFHLQGSMSSDCYSANIDAFGEHNCISEAEKAFNCCLDYKKSNVLVFNVMIKANGINRKFENACRILDSMESYDQLPDACSYNSLIQMLAGANLPDMALPYLRKMQKSGLVNDCIPYCAVISSFVKMDQLENAKLLHEEMVGFNVKPDVVVYGVLINAFANSGSVEEAVRYVDELKELRIPMNEIIYNSLIKLYTKVGYLKEAEETYEMLKSDVYSSNCMIDLYSERSMVKQAEGIFESLREKGTANEFSYAMMLCMYKKLGRLEEGHEIVKKMREMGFLNEVLSYNNVLGLYSLNGRFREGVKTFKEMIRSSVQPDDSTFKPLGVILVKCGVAEKAVVELEVLRRECPERGLQAWMSTLDSIVCLNKLNE
ncbi:pentatricopeptide repeat-containing protein At3g23020 [Impatiens glandulifera]|uniref:pentatricopeptide repeat-containing protein At3g23020 n=1 Tax=Impatiens glandulifera TaxID=253017 RepID=UPI001FB18775|nr:pentatricopeptide repeat-containing protein At3g23020 [Impatiens glandulifera]